jgi:hypothetical protein
MGGTLTSNMSPERLELRWLEAEHMREVCSETSAIGGKEIKAGIGLKFCTGARHGASCLLYQLLRRQRMEGSQIKTSLEKNTQDPFSTSKKLSMVTHACYPSYSISINGRIRV